MEQKLDIGQEIAKLTSELEGVKARLQLEITKRRIVERQLEASSFHIGSINAFSSVIQKSLDINELLQNMVEKTLSFFSCDRVFLLYPCDISAPSFRILAEAVRPEFPGGFALRMDIPITKTQVETFDAALKSDRPVVIVNTNFEVLKEEAEVFDKSGIIVPRSVMLMAVRPKTGAAWMFGLHQCSYSRQWSDDEKNLFHDICIRLADGINIFTLYKRLKESHESLERRVAEEIEKNRMKDQLMFEQSRQIAIGELLVNISHQWRQPLGVVSLFVQDIRDAYRFNELTDDYLNKSVNIVMDELQKLSDTIDNFRKLYRIEKETKPFSIAQAVKNALAVLAPYYAMNNITINADIEEDIIVEGYPNEFSKVILNILNNTNDVFEERNIKNGEITIKSYKDIKNGKAVLTICDNGGGVSDEIRNKIFDPYFTTKPKSRGAGLGLYMAKVIIENNMNGSIKAAKCGNGLKIIIEVSLWKG
ncbi:multi-sensor signal transduction histidine kinase [Candidatus Magnetoovum chiemensis]|nr:multi-sensor signal transduction histidine kinase [Candidatus Magnetoovum chiemensis]